MYSAARNLYEHLKSCLQNGKIGVMPSERELSIQYKLGRSAVRSALQRLEEEQLIFNDRAHHRRIAASYPRKLNKVIILRTENPLYNHSTEALAIIVGISKAVRRLGGEPSIFFPETEDKLKILSESRDSEEISGIICVEDCIETALGEDYLRLLDAGIPIVIANYECRYRSQDNHIPSTRIDFRDIGRLGGRALLKEGRRRIGIIGKAEWPVADEISAGLRGAMAEDMLQFDPSLVFCEDVLNPSDGNKLHRQLMLALNGPNRPDGFIVFRHYRLFRLLKCCSELGLRIPEDIDVVLYDCPGEFDYNVNMKLLAEPVERLGYEAVRMVSEWCSSGQQPEDIICQLS